MEWDQVAFPLFDPKSSKMKTNKQNKANKPKQKLRKKPNFEWA